MNITWHRAADGGWLAYECGRIWLHIGARSLDDIQQAGHDRYCVFGHANYDKYCGDLPIDMPEEDLKAAAAVMWRLSK